MALKSRNIGIFLGCFFIIASLAGLVTVSILSLLSSVWVILPMLFFVIGFVVIYRSINDKPPAKVETLTEKKSTAKVQVKDEYQNDLAHALNQFTLYAEGAISKEQIDIPKDSEVYRFVSKLQEAHFTIDLHLEVDHQGETQESIDASKKDVKEQYLSLLEESSEAFKKISIKTEEKPEAVLSEADRKAENAHGFDDLFAKVEEAGKESRIKRPIYRIQQLDVSADQWDNFDSLFESKRKYVLFCVPTDGNCVFYCIDIRDRESMLNLIIEYLDDNAVKGAVFELIVSEVKKVDPIVQDFNDAALNALCPSTTLDGNARKKQFLDKRPEIFERLKMLSGYYDDNQKFGKFIKKYMQSMWFSNAVIYELSCAINRRTKKGRIADEFHLVENGSRIIKRNMFVTVWTHPPYLFFWDPSLKGMDEHLAVFEDEQFFYYQFMHPSGKVVKNQIDKITLIQAFSEHSAICEGKEDAEKISYETFIQALKENQLTRDQQRSAMQIIFPIIAKQGDPMPQPYRYNYLSTNVHSSRLGALDDIEGLMQGKIGERHFNLAKTQEEYDQYISNWVKPPVFQ